MRNVAIQGKAMRAAPARAVTPVAAMAGVAGQGKATRAAAMTTMTIAN